MKLTLLLIGLTLLAGCQKRPAGPEIDLVVPVPCITAPVRMRNCVEADPQKCKSAVVTWAKGCEQVQTVNGPRTR